MTSTTARSVTITLPLPDKNTGGNNRGRWATAKARGQLRTDAFYAALATVQPWFDPFDRVTITINWYAKRGPLPDLDNMISRIKSAVDGFCDAGLIPDDSLDHVVGYQLGEAKRDPKNPRVELTIVEVGE